MEELDELREKINRVDGQLLKLIKQRVELVERIGQVKRKKGLDVKDPKREETVLSRLSGQGLRIGLDPKIIRKVWRTFFKIAYIIEKTKNE